MSGVVMESMSATLLDRLMPPVDGAPRLIQAGMGVRISSAYLARSTARLGALGVISSVGLRHIVAEEIRAGDQEAIEIARTFPIKRYVDELLEFAPGGPKHGCAVPMDHPNPTKGELPKRLSAICAYVEVMRAKLGHRGVVGINVMWKCSLTVLPSIYGAMLAGIDYLLCGAGVPMELPEIVRRIRAGEDMEYLPLHGTDTNVRFNISEDASTAHVSRFAAPKLIPILSNFAFPKRILDIWSREHNTRPDAFVLENHRAGGHNAPPRNKVSFSEPDEITSYFRKVVDLGVPVYIAGSGSSHDDLLGWMDAGAYGLQVGSRFALCDESGMRRDLKDAVIAHNASEDGAVLTSNRLSSTGYPFKFVPLPGTLSDNDVYQARERVCNHGYLQSSHFDTLDDGSVKETYICTAMPEKQYVSLGGVAEDTANRVCLCNALLATAGLSKTNEPALVTLGENGLSVTTRQSARDVIEDIMSPEYVDVMERRLALDPVCLGSEFNASAA